MFFGLDWLLAFVKISFQIVFCIVTAIPATIAWNCVAPIYLPMIPKLYHHLPFWHVVAIMLVVTYVGELVNRLTPKLVNIDMKQQEGRKESLFSKKEKEK